MNKTEYIIVRQGRHHVGLKDKDGNFILECKYDKVLDYDDDGYIRFIQNECYGTIDLQGKTVISLNQGITHLGVFYSGVARARRDEIWYMCDVNGEPINEKRYKFIEPFKKGHYIAYNMDGEEVRLSDLGEEMSNTIIPKIKPSANSSKPENFDEQFFLKTLQRDYYNPNSDLHFFYRDTDLQFDTEKLYIPGEMYHAEKNLIVSDKLLRPVCKTRFLIVSSSAELFNQDTTFLVWDVYKLGGVTQVTLLYIPNEIVPIIQQHNVDLLKLNPVTAVDEPLQHAVRADLARKLCDSVHGQSLQPDWQSAMHDLVG